MKEKIKIFLVYIFLILWIGSIIYLISAFGDVWNSDEAKGIPRKYDPRLDEWVPDPESPFWPDYSPY